MQQYMSHSLHGRMPVYSQEEIDYNAKSGWILDEVEDDETDDVPRETNQSLVQQYEAKFGKKPHWKAKQETIENALKE